MTSEPTNPRNRELLQELREAIALADERIEPDTIDVSMSLLDLGFDSLKLLRLTVAIEEIMQIPEFPLQAWLDEQSEQHERAYSVGSLLAICRECVLAADSTRDVS